MKRILIVVFCLWALIALTGCQKEAKSTSIPKSTPVPTYLPETQDKTTTPSEKTEEPTSSIDNTKPTPSPYVTVDWQTISYRWEDNSGYKFEATIKISPWINTKNTDYVTAAWNEVGNGKTIPDFDPNERAYYNGKCGFDGITNLTDMYYCIGELTVKNITPDWSISSDNPIISQDVCLSPVQKADENSTSVRNSRTIAKVTYSNEVKSNYTWAIISPKLTSDNWGPVPFVFAHYDRKTPKYPNGEYSDEMTDTVFCISNVHYSRIYSSTAKINLIEES